ncbi:MAG: hypothetical protein KAI81_04400 [Candidatus Marinimicrobia bacterium]|nr:hypothetical protein [Candidatus Neomarinimicrobiota bacterium]
MYDITDIKFNSKPDEFLGDTFNDKWNIDITIEANPMVWIFPLNLSTRKVEVYL